MNMNTIMNTTWLYDRTSSAAKAPPAELEPRFAAVSRALNYLNFTFSRQVYVQIMSTFSKSRRLSSLNFLKDKITFARKLQYTCEIKVDKITSYNFQLFFVTRCLILTTKI